MKMMFLTLTHLCLMLSLTTALTAVTVSGTVVGSDNPVSGLPDAMVTLSGNNNYTATTNAQGQFVITDVEPNATYDYLIEKEGYYPAEGTINIGSVNYSFGTIVLNEIFYPPTDVQAEIIDDDVHISWTHTISPMAGFYYLPVGFYLWAVKAIGINNVMSIPVFSNELGNTVANQDDVNPAVETGLQSCQPNPFRSETQISFVLKANSSVSVEVFNTKGQKVKTLVKAARAAGVHHIIWEGTDNDNQLLPDGLYFCKLTAGKTISIKKLVLLK
jgi:hypothetical protein